MVAMSPSRRIISPTSLVWPTRTSSYIAAPDILSAITTGPETEKTPPTRTICLKLGGFQTWRGRESARPEGGVQANYGLAVSMGGAAVAEVVVRIALESVGEMNHADSRL